jgi:hypothetical protein
VGVKRGENDVQGMIGSKSNMINPKMKLVDGLPGSEGLFAATGIEKKLRLTLSLIMIAAIALDRAKLQHARVPVQHRRRDHKENQRNNNNWEDWKRCGAG